MAKKLVASVLVASLLLSVALPVSAAAATEKRGEDYIAPQFYHNDAGEPSIGVTTKAALKIGGKYFKDSNGNGKLDVYEDWRKPISERSADLISQMNIDEKVGLMVINSRGMGINQEDKKLVDKSGLLDEAENLKDTSIFGVTSTYGTIDTIEKLELRHFILRQNPEPEDLAQWINMMNQVAEADNLGVPVLVASNSRNENADATFGMNDASGVFSTWPGTMGIAAAAKGSSNELITTFAEIARNEWDSSGIKKGYMYMADTMTDPRWQRTYGTFGEDVDFISDTVTRLTKGFQGENGLRRNGVALTIKHFPGGGARENGFDPHYAEGKWNVYATSGSLQKYHLPPFQAAVDAKASSVMPYYAMPSAGKSAPQVDLKGNPIRFDAIGMALNAEFMGLLRNKMGHTGYINSDSGIIGNMSWGVENDDVPTRAAKAINAGTDIISDTNDIWSIKEAYNRGLITDARVDLAVSRLLKEEFQLGLFENPYRNPQMAKKEVDNKGNWNTAYRAHQQSVVLLKNTDNLLPLNKGKLDGKKVYVQYFSQVPQTATDKTNALRKSLKETLAGVGGSITNDYQKADFALLFVDPNSGDYFNATPGFLEIDICEGKTVRDVNPDGIPLQSTHNETTLTDANQIKVVADAVHANGGKVISNINFKLAWLVGNVEPYSDALLAGFDTFTSATTDVILGKFYPTGRLPITLPKNDDVIYVNANGICVSPNDVPGYAKDQYLKTPAKISELNAIAKITGSGETYSVDDKNIYAYVDADGNAYSLNHGLRFK